MNSRTCERICGFRHVLAGYQTMVTGISGEQWNEGDVSCSVVRRVALPDAFFAVDGAYQALYAVLDDFGSYPAVIQAELDRYLPFLTTTKVLVAAVRAGVGREQAHEAIKDHSVAAALRLRERGGVDNDLLEQLASDPRLGLTIDQLRDAMGEPLSLTGTALAQVDRFVAAVEQLLQRFPDAAGYRPAPIL
jgi:adenylosuccinate lyase